MSSVTSDSALPREDIPALTGLRFIAAFSVLVAHGFSVLLANHETPMGFIYWVKQASGFGMTLFFVLSGFVIHYNYASLVTAGGHRGVAAYLWARFARLYPLFLLMMVVYVLVSSRNIDFWTGHPERLDSTLRALPYFLTSIHSWLYRPIDGNSLLSAIGGASPLTWSISTEWFFYLIYPCVAWLILRARSPQLVVAVALLWCACWIAFASYLYDHAAPIDAWAVARYGPVAGVRNNPQDSFMRWLLYFSPYLRMGEFLLGTLVAQMYVKLRHRRISRLENAAGTTVLVVAAASVLLVTYWEYSPDVGINVFRKMNMNFALAPSAALLIYCAARYRNVVTHMLTSRLAISLGDASYSIYLVHYVVLKTAERAGGSAVRSLAFDAGKLVAVIAAILLISRLIFVFYEAPARRWLRRR